MILTVKKWKLFSELINIIENDKEMVMLLDINELWAHSHKYTIEELEDLILKMKDM